MTLRIPFVRIALLGAVVTGGLGLAGSAHAATPLGCTGIPLRTVPVATSTALKSALASSRPGDRLVLADGTYAGRFTLATSGTALARIQVCGSSAAVLDGGSWTTGYGLTLKASNVDLIGFTIMNSQKGIVADSVANDVLDGLTIANTGDEGIHLRTASHDNVVRNSSIHDTGLREADFGEGVYIGSAYNNWCSYTACQPDRSDRNSVVNSTFRANGAEGVDIKEGTTGTLVSGNSFDGTGSSALSWVDAKGNGAMVTSNSGRVALRDGFLTEVGASGWGVNNLFALNYADVQGPGYGVNVKPGNQVACTNVVTHAAKGYSNIACL